MIKSNLATYMYRSQSLMAGQELKEGIGRQELIHLNSDSKNGVALGSSSEGACLCGMHETVGAVISTDHWIIIHLIP